MSEKGSAKPHTKLIDFTHQKLCSSADREGALFWTNGSVGPKYMYPEQTPTGQWAYGVFLKKTVHRGHNGIGALGLDALPVTIETSYGGQCHTLLLATRICLCGGAWLYTVGSSSKIARKGLTSHGTSATRFWGRGYYPQREGTRPKYYHFDKILPGVDKFTRSLNS